MPPATLNQWLRTYARQFWRGIAILGVLSLVATGLQLASPWPTKILVDSVFGSIPAPGPLAKLTGTPQLLLIVAVALIALYAIRNLLDIGHSLYSAAFTFRFDFTVKSELFQHLMHLGLADLGRHRTGDYVYRENVETDSVSGLIVGTTLTLFQSLIMVVGVLIVLLKLNWRLALVSLVMVPLLALTIRFFSGRLGLVSKRIEESTSDVYDYTSQSIRNVPLVQSFNQEGPQLRQLQRRLIENFHERRHGVLLGNLFSLTNDTIATVATAALILIGGSEVFHQRLTLGELIIFLTYITYLYGPLQTLSSAISSIQSSLASIRRVYEVLAAQSEISEKNAATRLERAAGQVELQDVRFAYDGHLVLDGANLAVTPGQHVVIVGPSGAGKSSLLALLPRFYDVERGAIRIDGTDVRNLKLTDLRRQFSIVSQEPTLFSGTIAENIAYGRPGEPPPFEDIVAAAGSANAYDFIKELPKGFDTPVGESGSFLSGGQKQRIAIARAFLKNAPILLLDEPTSALDAESEAAVVEALDRLMHDRTTLLVTHRPASLRQADMVYRLDHHQLEPLSAAQIKSLA